MKVVIWWKLSFDKIIIWWKLSIDESYLLMKVEIVKEVIACDVLPVAMFWIIPQEFRTLYGISTSWRVTASSGADGRDRWRSLTAPSRGLWLPQGADCPAACGWSTACSDHLSRDQQKLKISSTLCTVEDVVILLFSFYVLEREETFIVCIHDWRFCLYFDFSMAIQLWCVSAVGQMTSNMNL